MGREALAASQDAAALGIAVIAADAARVAVFEALVHDLGHRLVEAAQADVILADHEPRAATTPVLVLGAHESSRTSSLPADASHAQLDAALRAVATGLLVRRAPESATDGFDELPEPGAHRLLTPRELEVLHAIGSGLSNKSIARALGISQHTVKSHIESLLRKLGARTRAEALAKALRRTVDL